MKSSVTIALVPSIKTGPWIYWNDLEGSLQKASDLGFDAVELFTSSADAINIRTLKDSVTRLELSVSAVGTGAGKVEKGLTLTDPDRAIREKATDFISDMIAFGAAFGAPAIIGSMQGNVFPGVEKKQALDWLAEGLSILGKRAEESGVPLIYEPLNRYETNLINDLSTGVAFI
jgi:sugar phosphate isomerase/epimerase